jgi:type II secretory pathway component PulF
LLRSGITLSEALPITAETTANRVYRREFEKLVDSVNRGEKISISLMGRAGLFPEVLVSMIAIGERSGNLSNTLIYLSEMYEAEVEDFTKNLSSLIEPVLMVFMGLLVGFIAISIITPIYGITQHLTPR